MKNFKTAYISGDNMKGAAIKRSNKILPVPNCIELKPGTNYCWFPVMGDSMTDGTERSIPDKSLILCRELSVKNIVNVPLYLPVVFHAFDQQGIQYSALKTICFIDGAYNNLRLRSYNPDSLYNDWWLPYHYIIRMYAVELVRLPDGKEFVPQSKAFVRP